MEMAGSALKLKLRKYCTLGFILGLTSNGGAKAMVLYQGLATLKLFICGAAQGYFFLGCHAQFFILCPCHVMVRQKIHPASRPDPGNKPGCIVYIFRIGIDPVD